MLLAQTTTLTELATIPSSWPYHPAPSLPPSFRSRGEKGGGRKSRLVSLSHRKGRRGCYRNHSDIASFSVAVCGMAKTREEKEGVVAGPHDR